MPLPSSADRHAYLIGGGIASLAAAVFLIRDGQVPAIYKGQFDPTVLFEAVKTLHR